MSPDFPQQPPVLPPHHVSQSMKVIMLVFGLILVGTLGFFIYDAQKAADDTDYTAPKVTTTETKTEETTAATDETADWKTYTHATLGFSVKHPKDWKVTTPVVDFSGNVDGVGVVFIENKDRAKSVIESSETGLAENIVFYYKNALASTDFSTWFAKNAEIKDGAGYYGGESPVTRSGLLVTDTAISGNPAKVQRYLEDHGSYGTIINKRTFIAAGKDVYGVWFTTKSPDNKKLETSVADLLNRTFTK